MKQLIYFKERKIQDKIMNITSSDKFIFKKIPNNTFVQSKTLDKQKKLLMKKTNDSQELIIKAKNFKFNHQRIKA